MPKSSAPTLILLGFLLAALPAHLSAQDGRTNWLSDNNTGTVKAGMKLKENGEWQSYRIIEGELIYVGQPEKELRRTDEYIVTRAHNGVYRIGNGRIWMSNEASRWTDAAAPRMNPSEGNWSPTIDGRINGGKWIVEPVTNRDRRRKTTKLGQEDAKAENGMYCRSQRIRMEDSFTKNIVGPNEAVLEVVYPGAMFYLSEFLEGNYKFVAANRAPITLYSDFYDGKVRDLADLEEDDSDNFAAQNTVEVEDVSKRGISTGLSTLVARKGTTTSTDAQLSVSQYHNDEQLSMELNAAGSYAGFDASASFGFDKSSEYDKIVGQFIERYFAIRCDDSQFVKPSDWFESEEEAQRILGAEEKGPLVYISSVAYGRALYFGLEHKGSSQEITAAFEASYDGVGTASADGKVAANKAMQEDKLTYVAIGQDMEANKAITDLDSFTDLLRDAPGNLNSGEPIAYVMRFVESGDIAAVNVMTEFVERKCTPITKGQVEVRFKGLDLRGLDSEFDKFYANVYVFTPQGRPALSAIAAADREKIQKADMAYKAEVINAMYGSRLPATLQHLANLPHLGPSWAYTQKDAFLTGGHVSFKMQEPPRDEYYEFGGDDLTFKDDLGEDRFLTKSARFQLYDDPTTAKDESSEVGIYITGIFSEDEEVFSFTIDERIPLGKLPVTLRSEEFNFGVSDGYGAVKFEIAVPNVE